MPDQAKWNMIAQLCFLHQIIINIDVTGARGNTEIMEAVQEGIRLGLEEYDREVLPGRVSEISQNPRMVG